MEKEKAQQLLSNIRSDIQKISEQMKRQELMGGVRPEHMFQLFDVKISLALGICIALVEDAAGQGMTEQDAAEQEPEKKVVLQ
jgi:hypothetical protein